MADAGRPEKIIDLNKLKMLAEAGCNLKSCAAQLECDVKTLVRRVKREYGVDFGVYSARHRDKGLGDLQAIIHHRATGKVSSKGSVQLLILLAKYKLGMNDYELEHQVKASHEKTTNETKKSDMQELVQSSKEMLKIYGPIAEPKPEGRHEEDA